VKTQAANPARTVTVRAPTRIDLGGGWTDVPPYCDELGGFVCNIAINRYAVATVRSSETYRGGADKAGKDATGAHAAADNPLIAAAVRRSGVTGVHVTVSNDFPVGAGLGGSSAASAAVLAALRIWRGLPLDLAEIAEEGRRIEVEDLGISGGRQDHFASTHGGALALTFTDRVAVRRLNLSDATRAAIESRALLVYTGESRISGSTVKAVLDAYRAGDRGVLGALEGMKAIALQMAEILEAGDLDALGALLAEHWEFQRSLNPAIPTSRIDEIVRCARDTGAIGWKAMGASGGGCVLVIARDGRTDEVRRAIEPLGELLSFALDSAGLARVGE
jgi:D-glycero-alpha-D-manno-heptose-7-phosphate kinase